MTSDQYEAEVRDRILAYPEWTLMRLGWEVEPGRVQGRVFYRYAGGLGPVTRDHCAIEILRQEVQGSHMPHDDQRWGIQILARPLHDESEPCWMCGVSPLPGDSVLDAPPATGGN